MGKVLVIFLLLATCPRPAKAAAQGAQAFAAPVPAVARIPVESASIASAGYHKRAKILEIEFRNGGVYQYAGVSVLLYKRFMRSESKGQFFQREIRGRYKYVRVR